MVVKTHLQVLVIHLAKGDSEVLKGFQASSTSEGDLKGVLVIFLRSLKKCLAEKEEDSVVSRSKPRGKTL